MKLVAALSVLARNDSRTILTGIRRTLTALHVEAAVTSTARKRPNLADLAQCAASSDVAGSLDGMACGGEFADDWALVYVFFNSDSLERICSN